jgi:hypothetical protein
MFQTLDNTHIKDLINYKINRCIFYEQESQSFTNFDVSRTLHDYGSLKQRMWALAILNIEAHD